MKGFGNKDKNKKVSIENKVKPLQQDQLITRAFSLHSSGKIKEALEIYSFLIKNKVDDPRIFINLGSIYYQLKQFDKAIFLFDESIKKFPNSLEAYPNLASVLVIKGKRDIAKKILIKAISVSKHHVHIGYTGHIPSRNISIERICPIKHIPHISYTGYIPTS